MPNRVFRNASVERLSSPEQLDQLMRVTSAHTWVALLTLCGLLGLAVAWGFAGSVPTRVQAMGVLIKTGGVYDIVPLGSGPLTDISVRPGDVVREGQVIARIDQPQLVDQLKQARLRLDDLQDRHRQLQAFGSEDAQLQAALTAQQDANLDQAIAGAEEQMDWLQEKIVNQEALYEQGLITRQAVLTTRQQLQSTQERAEDLRSERKQLSIRLLSQDNQRRQDLLASRMQISELEQEIAQLTDQLDLATQVTSPYTGRILEVMAEVGSLVGQGRPIMRLDRIGDDVQNLEAVLYIPSQDGKRIKPGMRVQVSPTTVRREEHGSMQARVTQVSDFPATPEGMARVLKNQQLVRVMSDGGAPYETYASLELDPSTVSGFKWSSSTGPDQQIQSGTIASATIIVEERRPAELVLPFLRKFLGMTT
ncbi:MAG: NHLP bacteriocin system secretion protein [Bacteroidota bacterium]